MNRLFFVNSKPEPRTVKFYGRRPQPLQNSVMSGHGGGKENDDHVATFSNDESTKKRKSAVTESEAILRASKRAKQLELELHLALKSRYIQQLELELHLALKSHCIKRKATHELEDSIKAECWGKQFHSTQFDLLEPSKTRGEEEEEEATTR